MLAPALIAAVLVSPPPQSTVSVVTADSCGNDVACSKYAQGYPVPVTTFTSVIGEASAVTVEREGGELVFSAAVPGIRAEPPCKQLDGLSASCPVTEGIPGIPGVAVVLGDGDDRLEVHGDLGAEATISGGSGNDTVLGGDGNEQIDGGPGDDVLNGGDGFDVLLYETRTEPVTVDLASAFAGEAGELDRLGGFETAVGGAGADRLRGGPAEEILDGGPGDDRVEGGGGADELFGSTGTDRLLGGAGGDRLFGDPAQGDDYYTPRIEFGDDRLSGGPGDDRLYDTGGANLMSGGPGRDLLEGGVGPDRLNGGSGRDRIAARGNGRDRVHCGPGIDRAGTDRRDVRISCERRWNG